MTAWTTPRPSSDLYAGRGTVAAGAVLFAVRVVHPGQFADELREERDLPIDEDGRVKPRQAVWKRFCNGCGLAAAAARTVDAAAAPGGHATIPGRVQDAAGRLEGQRTKGLRQTTGYRERCAADAAKLVMFDRSA